MTNITGARITTNVEQARRVVDMSNEIALLDPNEGPFVTILKKIKNGGQTRVAYSPKFEWLEDDYIGSRTTVATAIASASATTLAVADGSIYRPYDIINLPTVGENMLVTAVSGNDLTVVRGYGSTTAAAAIAVGAEVLNIGSAMTENSLARERRSTKETPCYNYTQIFRTPVELSNTEDASKLYGGKDRAYQRRKMLIEHKRDIARAMYFGQRKEDTGGGAVRRTMGGLLEFIRSGSNVQAFASGGTQLNYNNFNTLVAQAAFKHGSKEKLLVCGGILAAAIDSWDMTKLQTKIKNDEDRKRTFGVNVNRLQTSYGILNIVFDPLLDGATYGGYGFILDMDNIKYAYLNGRDTKLNTNIQANDQDGVMDEYITECGLEVRNPNTHFLVTGAYVG